MTGKRWTISLLLLVGTILLLTAGVVGVIDPYFHFHKPVEWFYYKLVGTNQRMVNNGIMRHFDFDAYITGTSMTNGFKASEFDELFGVHSVKVPFAGASYKEINDNQRLGYQYNDSIRIVIRGLDYNRVLDATDEMRYVEYPTYLYDDNPFNDVAYLWNRDTLLYISLDALYTLRGKGGGMTTFDDYSNDINSSSFGIEEVRKSVSGGKENADMTEQNADLQEEETTYLTEEDIENTRENVRQNVTALAGEHPETDFYYFFTPYSIFYWNGLSENGTIDKQIDAERIAIEMILEQPNIHLFSFNNRTDITTNLDNYKDAGHYGEWINSEMLHMMKDGEGLLTKENYEAYLRQEREFYNAFDYAGLWE